ncbi:MAG: HAD-IIIA family hydrolase [Bacteroidaceae bacterium]|nr:HAD-IIIA family hydrolase [Bacteroidaceae bacterium]
MKSIIFDLDGTLLDTLRDLANAVNHALKKNGMPERSIDEVRQFVGNGVRKLMERAVPDGIADDAFDAVFRDFRTYYSEHSLDYTKPYEGIADALRTLKQSGLRMAIVSNKMEEATEALRQHFFADTIETAIGDAPERRRKPAPDGVFEAMRRLGVTADECVYVGDSDVDYLTARNAAVPCISVLWGFRDRTLLESLGATNFCETPQELPQAVRSLG